MVYNAFCPDSVFFSCDLGFSAGNFIVRLVVGFADKMYLISMSFGSGVVSVGDGSIGILLRSIILVTKLLSFRTIGASRES